MYPETPPAGDPAREAIDSLRGYVYQIYQAALAWTKIEGDAFLFLEVAEDFAVAARNAIEAVQVKESSSRVTINSDGILTSIDSFVELKERNPNLNVSLRHMTTSTITREKSAAHRIGNTPTLISWRNLAKTGDLRALREVLGRVKLADKTKCYIQALDDNSLREQFLKKIHFDCGAPDSRFLARQLNSSVSRLLMERGGYHSQAASCTADMLLSLLKLSTEPNRGERFVDRNGLENHLERATRVSLNRAQFEAHNRLMERALSASVSTGSNLSSASTTKVSRVSEVPLPVALAERKVELDSVVRNLECFGFSWLFGAAGMGKTVAARITARRIEGAWASINLRGLNDEQAATALAEVAASVAEYGVQGLLIDDLECAFEPPFLDNLSYLFASACHSDVLVICTGPSPPPADFLFTFDLPGEVAVQLREFSEDHIQQILAKKGVHNSNWAKYIHLVSGGGHPQLAVASIQGMAASSWDPRELETFDALLEGSPAVEEVRRRTRQRLLSDLPETSRRLIERLSLKIGSFTRDFAIDMARVPPPVSDAGCSLSH